MSKALPLIKKGPSRFPIAPAEVNVRFRVIFADASGMGVKLASVPGMVSTGEAVGATTLISSS